MASSSVFQIKSVGLMGERLESMSYWIHSSVIAIPTNHELEEITNH